MTLPPLKVLSVNLRSALCSTQGQPSRPEERRQLDPEDTMFWTCFSSSAVHRLSQAAGSIVTTFDSCERHCTLILRGANAICDAVAGEQGHVWWAHPADLMVICLGRVLGDWSADQRVKNGMAKHGKRGGVALETVNGRRPLARTRAAGLAR